MINFAGVEDFLKEVCWSYIGKSIQEIRDKKDEISLEAYEDLNYVSLFRDYLSKINLDNKDDVEKNGEQILLDLQ